jgi:hypothetical protein
MAGYGAIPRFQNPALAAGGQAAGGPTLEREITNTIGGQFGDQEITRLLQQQPVAGQQQQAGGTPSGQSRSMDWRARAAELMRRQMIDRSNEEGQPPWMRRRT